MYEYAHVCIVYIYIYACTSSLNYTQDPSNDILFMKQIRLPRAGLHIFWLLALKRSKALEKFERLRIVLHDILLSTVASALVIGPYWTSDGLWNK